MNNPSDKSGSCGEEEAETQKLYDIFDEVLEASQDPDDHPAFEQLRKHLNDNSE